MFMLFRNKKKNLARILTALLVMSLLPAVTVISDDYKAYASEEEAVVEVKLCEGCDLEISPDSGGEYCVGCTSYTIAPLVDTTSVMILPMAGGHSDTVIDLGALDVLSSIASGVYSNWSYSAYTVSVMGNITVTGAMALSGPIWFEISSGATLTWDAELTTTGTVILEGGGVFTMTGGKIENSDNNAITVGNDSSVTVNIADGTVFSGGGSAIDAYDTTSSTINITGGTISATGDNARGIDSRSPVSISGGFVSATGTYSAAVYINGAAVSIGGSAVLYAYSYYSAVYGATPTVTGNGLVISREINGNYYTQFTKGSGTDLSVSAANISVTDAYWDISGGSPGITYKINGTVLGFIPVSGVTIHSPPVPKDPLPLLIAKTNSASVTFYASDIAEVDDDAVLTITGFGWNYPSHGSILGIGDLNYPTFGTIRVQAAAASTSAGRTVTIPVTVRNDTNVPGNSVTFNVTFAVPTAIITYDGNGSTGGTVPAQGIHLSNTGSGIYTVEGAGDLTRTGYIFNDWNTAANGSGTAYAAGAPYTEGLNGIDARETTLYAQWLQTISARVIGGVTAPVAGATPVTSITETAQYTGTVTWSGSPATFGYNTAYTATISLSPKQGYTLTGLGANFFTVAGASPAATNAADSGAITATFPATAMPPLSGTASISGTSAIGQTLTAALTDTTPGSGIYSYQWRSGGVNTGSNSSSYVLVAADAGKTITCIITRTNSTGSLTATLSGGVVPYNIEVVNSGNSAGDTAVSLSAPRGRAGDSITVSYVLGNGGGMLTNILSFTGATGLTTVTAAGANTSQAYTVRSGDAVNGVITIDAVFLHTNLAAQFLTFANTHIDKTHVIDTAFTHAAGGILGTGAVTYTSSNTAVAKVDNTGKVTIIGVGDATITVNIAGCSTYIESTASYTLRVHQPVVYNVIFHNGTWIGKGTTSAKVDADHLKFIRLMLNGEIIDPGNYTITPGSTIITLSENFVKTLSNGTHTFRAAFTDGYADLILIVNMMDDTGNNTGSNAGSNTGNNTENNTGNNTGSGVPRTGDYSDMLSWWLVLTCSMFGFLCMLFWRKKHLQ